MAHQVDPTRPFHKRAGIYRKQPTGYWAFIPTALPVQSPPIDLDRIEPELSNANLAIGRLDGIAGIVPNPDLFVAMYLRKEAVLSSQIEGTQASLSDLLEAEAGVPEPTRRRPPDVREVQNYVNAMKTGLARLHHLPLSLRLIREVHSILLKDVRGRDKTPGEFRRSQNWIGPEGCDIRDAAFVPPPHQELAHHLGALEKYIRQNDNTPILVRAGVVHAQFETIHPFLDGNGRLGRLLITFMLCERQVLSRPLLYLSHYFTRRKNAYYQWLMKVRETGDWEGWLRFYLQGVSEVATGARETASRVLELQRKDRDAVYERFPTKPNLVRVLDFLYLHPTITIGIAATALNLSVPTMNSLVRDLVALNILTETTGRERDRVFRHVAYLQTLTPDEPRSLSVKT